MRGKLYSRFDDKNFISIGIAAIFIVTLCALATLSKTNPTVTLQSASAVHRQPLSASGNSGILLPAARSNNIRVFSGKMLCGVGETSCVHPCDAFYTITDEPIPEDCKCKCVAPNPHEFYSEGSTICTCPGSPISPENDLFPYPEGEGPAPRNNTDEEETAVATSASHASSSLSMRRFNRPVYGNRRYPVLRRGYEPRIAQWSKKESRYGRIALPTLPARVNQGLNRYEPAPAFTYRPRNGGLFGSWWQSRPNQGLWVGSPPPYLPPDGDYPGGSTGIPMDGYLAFETGYGEEPYHGIYAPMQEAGISS